MTDNTRPVPQHVAIVMDGNGRWAQSRGLPRLVGHKQGAEAVERITRAASERGIKYLTLFAFSTENWKRPAEEVQGLMGLLKTYLSSKAADMHENNVRLRIIGDRARLGADIQTLIASVEELTRNNTGITVNMALSYSGRWDVKNAMQVIAEKLQNGSLQPNQITEELIGEHLQTAGQPDPDLIIRTSGEQRTSNFLLWQGAYSEYFFTQTHWPDFDAALLDQALADYAGRERRFGKLKQTHVS